METIEQLKKELIEKIAGIEDYSTLQALREDVQLYEVQNKTEEGPYDFPGATDEERAELIRLDNGEELDEEEYVTQEEFQKLMKKWLTE